MAKDIIIGAATKISKMEQISNTCLYGTEGLSNEDKLEVIKVNFERLYPKARIIYMTETGSGLHGTSASHWNELNSDKSDKSSDFDVKGIYLPSIETIISGKKWAQKTIEIHSNAEDKNSEEDIDVTLIPLNSFIELVSTKMEANSLEILFSMFSGGRTLLRTPKSKLIEQYHKELLFNRTEALTKFAVSMASKYSDKGRRVIELDETINFLNGYMKRNDIGRRGRKKRTLDEIPKEEWDEFLDGKEYVLVQELAQRDTDKMKKYLTVVGRSFIFDASFEYIVTEVNRVRAGYGNRASGVADKSKDEDYIDKKAYAHAFRALYQAIELVETGKLVFPLSSAEELMRVKYGEGNSREELSQRLEDLEFKLQQAKEKSILPSLSNEDKLEELRLRLYGLS